MTFFSLSFLTGKGKKKKNNDAEGKPVENIKNKTEEKDYFAALISSLIPDQKVGCTEARTITIKNASDAQLIITDINDNESLDDVFDRILHFLGARLDPKSAGRDILALDPLVERIFIRKTQNEAIEYPVFDETGKPAQTAILKNPLMVVARKGLRLALENESFVQNDRLYVPISVNMSVEQIDALVNELYRHKAVKVLTRTGVIKNIGINPDIALIDAVMPHFVSGYPSFSPLEWEMISKSKGMAETIYVWLEVKDRRYYNKILTQISEIITNFYTRELEKHKEKENGIFELEIQPAVFATWLGIGGEMCSLIPFIGSGYLFSSKKVVFSSDNTYTNTNMKKINSMGIKLKPNPAM
jgi:hypothetical protein